MQNKQKLKRSLGVWLLVFYGLGNILGAGIYVLVGKVAGAAGYFAPLSFALAAFVAAFTAFTYAELSARYPVAAGEVVYLQEGFGQKWLSLLVGLLIAAAGMLSAATITRGFAGYMQVFITQPDWLIIIVALAILGLVAIWGISESVRIAAVLTLLEIAGLILIIVTGSPNLDSLPSTIQSLPPLTDTQIWPGIFIGAFLAFLAFYAFIGFEDMVNVAEEAKQPEKNMPRAIIIALIVSTVLYVSTSLIAVSNLSPEALTASKAPLADIYVSATGKKPIIITFISLFAVINGALIQIIMVARIFYGMSNRGWLPSVFSKVSQRTHTPILSTLAITLAIALLALWFPLQKLAESTSYLTLSVFLLVNLALLRIRKSTVLPANVRAFPIWVPAFGAIGSLFLLLAQLGSTYLKNII